MEFWLVRVAFELSQGVMRQHIELPWYKTQLSDLQL